MSRSEVAWPITPLNEQGAIQNVWVKALHDYFFGKGDLKTLLDSVAAQATQILKDSGTLK